MNLNGSVRASWLREGVGGKPARAESPGRGGKSELVSSFCRLASPRLATADLDPKTDPERSEWARPKINYDDDYINVNVKDWQEIIAA